MRRHRDILKIKLRRDMSRSLMQFFALIVLCVLGTFLFSGIDGIARMIGSTNTAYFSENRLADFFITVPQADRRALTQVRQAEGVADAAARFTLTMETTLPGEPTISVTAYDGAMTINVPIIAEGAALDPADKRGCLVQHGFAEAHGLTAGDKITVKLNGLEYTLLIRGVAYSPEYVNVTDGISTDPNRHGFLLANACAFPGVPLDEIVALLSSGADADAARAEIADALPLAFILDRSAHASTAAVMSFYDIFASLAIVFPLAAYAVAALIVMTTLTRMIDNQRMQLGTLKALGFPAGQITRHYLSYALVPSTIGAVAGALIGHVTLPPVVWDMVLGQYEYPYRIEPPISAPAWGIVLLIIVMSTGICLIAYRRSARECTAALLRPKPPKDGKRILLERITPLWKSLSFNGKMICRNLLRSKLRTAMSLIGLLCCNALLIASLGLQDSIKGTVYAHYGSALDYDYRADLNASAGQAESYIRRLDAETVECIMETSGTARANNQQKTVLITVIEDNQQTLRLGKNQTFMPILPGVLAVTERFAEDMGVSIGDTVSFSLPGDDMPFALTIGQVAENNFSKGVYMTRSTWEALRKGDFILTAIHLKAPTAACLAQLDDMDEVDDIDDTVTQSEEALVALEAVSSIFLLLVFIALALAFVICYNMGLINFAERTREYATLKVLGYHQKEIRRLITRENAIVTAISIALSIYPGVLLTDLILLVAQTDTARYVNHIAPVSIVISCVITAAFSAFIQRLLVRKVRTIDMVEALKSVE